jgi:hypothetical protein
MNGKLKALGLGVLAAMAASALAVVGASAQVAGHFSSDVEHTLFIGTENATHNTQFSVDGGGPIRCHKTSYTYTGQAKLLAGVRLVPKYEECTTVGQEAKFTFTTNGCLYTLKTNSGGAHATFFIECPNGTPMEIHHPNCTMTIPEKKLLNGVSYTTLLEGGKHALTVNVTVSGIPVEYHGGACIILGTSHKGAWTGSFTLKGTDKAGNLVNITAT